MTALLAIAFVLMSPGLAGSASAAAVGDAPERATEELEITAVSPWVEAEGTFEVSFSIPRDWPLDVLVTATIQQRLRPGSGDLRSSTDRLLAEEESTRNLQAPIAFDLASLVDGSGSALLQIPIRSSSGDNARQLIPNAGIHPVELEVTDSGGQLLASSTVYLNRLPVLPRTGRDDQPARTSLQLLAGLDSGPALGPDGEPSLSTEERLAMAPWQELIQTNVDLPLTVALRPNTLLALQRSPESSDRAFLTELSGDTALTISPQSYVRVDAAGLERTGSGELARQVRLGTSTLGDLTSGPPNGPWILDDTVDVDSAQVLAGMGVSHLVVSEDRLELDGQGEDDDESTAASGDLLRHRTFALSGVPGMSVSTYDAAASRLLVSPGTPAALTAHRVTTALIASWFDAIEDGPEAFPGVSAALLVSPDVDHAVLQSLVTSVTAEGPLEVAEPPEPSHDGDGSPITAGLAEREPENLDNVVSRMRGVSEDIDGFRSMTGPDNPLAAQWDLLNDQTPASSAGPTSRSATWNGIEGSIDQQLARIETPPRRTVVLTARTGSIPVRIRNDLDGDVRLRMTARSPRLDFPDGPTTEVLLTPGLNRIDLPVEVQAPGSSLLRIELTSPDSALALREVTVTVRSSSISGVGAALSVLSVLVLALWWTRTFRARRSTVAAQGSTGSGDGEQ